MTKFDCTYFYKEFKQWHCLWLALILMRNLNTDTYFQLLTFTLMGYHLLWQGILILTLTLTGNLSWLYSSEIRRLWVSVFLVFIILTMAASTWYCRSWNTRSVVVVFSSGYKGHPSNYTIYTVHGSPCKCQIIPYH